VTSFGARWGRTSRPARCDWCSSLTRSPARAIVEFLNAQMNTTEVLALEVRQYVAEDGAHQTLVPRLIGQTEAARQAKGRTPRRQWSDESWLAVLRERRGPRDVEAAEALFAWARHHDPPVLVQFGTGEKDVSALHGWIRRDPVHHDDLGSVCAVCS
jgi:hypothetical protein